jgi:hypothetical protein
MIDADELHELVRGALFHEDELTDGQPEAGMLREGHGVMANLGFHAIRLEETREKVVAMIDQLPTEFLPSAEGGGGGWSFLNLCMTKDGTQWGEHVNCDELIVISNALGLCDMTPRFMWQALPGGVPYIEFRKEKKPVV